MPQEQTITPDRHETPDSRGRASFSTRLAPDDRVLLWRMSRREGRALEDFYVRWEPSVRKAVFLRESDFENTEDAVAEVFWRVWRDAWRFETSDSSAELWLLEITRSVCLERCRTVMHALSTANGST